MKKAGILSQPISSLIASMGHTDSLVVCDAGLPIPPESQRIDLALRCGMPPFLEVLEVVLSELEVERAVVASQTKERSPLVYTALEQMLPEGSIELVDHEELKRLSGQAKGIVRSGECTPFANVILYSGVVF